MEALSGKAARLFKKAANKHKNGKYTEAETIYQKILKLDAEHIDANYMLGTLYAEQKKPQQAKPYMVKAQQLAPASEYIRNNLGNVYRMIGDYDKAMHCYQQAIAGNPGLAEAYNNLAIVFRHRNELNQAVAHYRKAISLKPGFVDAHWNLGKAYLDNADFSDAEACFQRVLDLRPQHAGALHELGCVYMQRCEPEKAAKYFGQYLQLVPEDPNGASLKLAYLKGDGLPDKVPATIIQQSYERKAQYWDENVEAADKRFLGPQHINNAIEDLQQIHKLHGLQVLDLGCGTGLCGHCLRPLASLLVGVDLSEHMLLRARDKKLYDHLACAEMEHYLQDKTRDFDLVVASGVMIFFGQLDGVFTKIFDTLRPGGHFVFTVYKNPAGEDIKIRDNIHFGHGREYLEGLLKSCGFSLCRIKDVIHEYEAGIPQPGFCIVAQKPRA